MSAQRDNLVRVAGIWMKYGEEDLSFARHGFSIKPVPPYRLIAYHAQQCVEKYIKAYLVFHGIDFPRTHNIGDLLRFCGDDALAKDLEESARLTSYAVLTRYPGVDETVGESEAKWTVEVAESAGYRIRVALLQKAKEEKLQSAIDQWDLPKEE